jgi:hypothetical protein
MARRKSPSEAGSRAGPDASGNETSRAAEVAGRWPRTVGILEDFKEKWLTFYMPHWSGA